MLFESHISAKNGSVDAAAKATLHTPKSPWQFVQKLAPPQHLRTRFPQATIAYQVLRPLQTWGTSLRTMRPISRCSPADSQRSGRRKCGPAAESSQGVAIQQQREARVQGVVAERTRADFLPGLVPQTNLWLLMYQAFQKCTKRKTVAWRLFTFKQ